MILVFRSLYTSFLVLRRRKNKFSSCGIPQNDSDVLKHNSNSGFYSFASHCAGAPIKQTNRIAKRMCGKQFSNFSIFPTLFFRCKLSD